MQPKLKHDQTGMSLPSVMVAVAITAIVSLALASLGKNVTDTAKAMSEQREKEDLRNLMRGNVDCAATKAKIAGSRSIVLYRRNGEPVFPTSDGVMSYGNMKVTITGYTSATGALNVQYRAPGMSNTRPLFTYAPFICF